MKLCVVVALCALVGASDAWTVRSFTKNIAGGAHYIGAASNDIVTDTTTSGGAPCMKDTDCGGVNAGVCNLTTTNNVTTGKCMCPEKLADVDCTYKRKNGDLAGGLQFLCFLGIGGVGNFILELYGVAVVQLLMLLMSLCAYLITCVIVCGAASGSDKVFAASGGVAICIYCCILCTTLAGLIWCIIDGALILQGEVLDGNGYLPWFPNA